MNKQQIGLAMKAISVLIWIAGTLSFVFGGIALYTALKLIGSHALLDRAGGGINRKAGTLAEIIGIAAGILWLIRTVMVQIKKRDSLLKEWLRQLYMVIRKHHIFLGILTLVLAFTHGLYFFLVRFSGTQMEFGRHDTTLNFYSGLAAFTALIVLALLGWNHQNKKKTKQNKPTKRNHMIAALVFGILALSHIYLF
jgi:cytochrome bd-type quinol oxidase subunit 2